MERAVVLDPKLGLAVVTGVIVTNPSHWKQRAEPRELTYVDHLGAEPLDMLALQLRASLELMQQVEKVLAIDPRGASERDRDDAATRFRRMVDRCTLGPAIEATE